MDEFSKALLIIMVLVMIAVGLAMFAIIQERVGGDDICETKCNELGKDPYVYKASRGGGFFSSPTHSECWCRENNDTVRIY